MKSPIHPKPISTACLIATLAAGNLTAETFTREFQRQFTAQPGQVLDIEVDSGRVQISPGQPRELETTGPVDVLPADSVSLTVVLTANARNQKAADKAFDAVSVQFDEEPDEIDLEINQERGGWGFLAWLFGPGKANVTVLATCPPDFDLEIETGSGDVRITGISGDLAAETGSGDIQAVTAGGALDAKTGSGDIQLDGFSGAIDLVTGSGDINASGAFSAFDLKTGSGDIVLRSVLSPESDSEAKAASGDVLLAFPESSTFAFNATSASGSISSGFPQHAPVGSTRKVLSLLLNNAEAPAVQAQTASGDVRLEIIQP